MTDLSDISVRIRNFKCFQQEEQGFDCIKPINLIIGRNNSGKSALLDLIKYSADYKDDLSVHAPPGHVPQIVFRKSLLADELKNVFREEVSGGGVPGRNHWEYGKAWVGEKIVFGHEKGNKKFFIRIEPEMKIATAGEYIDRLIRVIKNPLESKIFKRLSAERDIVPETSLENLAISEKGAGATNAIQQFINNAALPSALVEETLLNELNKIMQPDALFTRIVVQQHKQNQWEIYLSEKRKGAIPLSHTGSGLKTIILILTFLILVPKAENKKVSDYLFGFEELENNLHPSLIRRLLLYLRDFVTTNQCVFFLTTHSNVSIDLFNKDETAQILHVTHDGEKANVRTVKAYIEHKNILDDLDIRASDLLQSNGIIWVEGPSDRLYFNRWVELVTDGQIREGAHYQCVFYGGRLLAHLTADDPDIDHDELIKILRINRNAIFLMDSDLRDGREDINRTKQRIHAEMESIGGMAWITHGKEVENYISREALISLSGNTAIRTLRKNEDFGMYLQKEKIREKKRFEANKVLFAEQICPHITRASLSTTLDLEEKVGEALKLIRKWNSMPETS